MIFKEKEIKLKDGRTALLRSPAVSDAEEMLQYLIKAAGETPFLLATPEERAMPIEREEAFLQEMRGSETKMMIVCMVDGKLARTCQISRSPRCRTRHRGSIGIALLQEFWGLGIGTDMMSELISTAEDWGLQQLELEVIEGNHRAVGLYEKMGFETVSATPNAIRLEDGTLLKEFLMVRKV